MPEFTAAQDISAAVSEEISFLTLEKRSLQKLLAEQQQQYSMRMSEVASELSNTRKEMVSHALGVVSVHSPLFVGWRPCLGMHFPLAVVRPQGQGSPPPPASPPHNSLHGSRALHSRAFWMTASCPSLNVLALPVLHKRAHMELGLR